MHQSQGLAHCQAGRLLQLGQNRHMLHQKIDYVIKVYQPAASARKAQRQAGIFLTEDAWFGRGRR